MTKRDEHGHFLKSEKPSFAALTAPKAESKASSAGWTYRGAEFNPRANAYVHLWTIAAPTGALLEFTLTTAEKDVPESKVIADAQARNAG